MGDEFPAFAVEFETEIRDQFDRADEASDSRDDKKKGLESHRPRTLAQEEKLKKELKGQSDLSIAPAVPFPDVFISYAWGDNQEAEGQRHDLLIDAVEQVLTAKGFKVLRDKNEVKLGNSLRNFMHAAVALFDSNAAQSQQSKQSKRILLILDDKYFTSPNCMFEFMTLWQNSGEDLQMFRKRTTVLNDGARYFHMEQRQQIATYWLKYAEKIRRGRYPPCPSQGAPGPFPS